MAKISGNARQTTSVSRAGEGAESYLRMLRDGTIGVADLIAIWSLEGRVFTANFGAATTPGAFQGGTLTTGEFDLHVAVPASVVIIPLEWTVNFDIYGTIQVVELALQYGTGSVVGTADLTDTPISSNANTGLTSACTVSFGSTTGTALTSVVNEFWHDGIQLGISVATNSIIRSQTKFSYKAMDSGVLQVIGASQQLVGFASAQAGTGFTRFIYAELPVAGVE